MAVGSVTVPVLEMVEITGVVRVLFVSVSVVARPTKVSVEVGNVSVPVLTILAITGVVRVGLIANTFAPVPVSSVSADARFALDGVAKKVATPVPKPETPVDIGSPVALVNTPDAGVPKAGVTKVGLVAKTKAPVPVSSEITPAS